jgi:hypothetical protein
MPMLAATTGELRLVIPAWGCILLAGVGAVYLLVGSRWPRVFNVLSMTVLGCIVGMVVSSWIPLVQSFVIILGGLILGGLTAFLRNVMHAVLSAIVLSAVLATLASLAVGQGGFTSYLVLNVSGRSFSTQISGPNLASDPVLAACLTGLLIGATVAIAWPRFNPRLVTAAQGAALVLVGLAEIISAYRGEGQPSLARAFPLTLSACWLCLVAIGLVAQRALARPEQQWDSPPDGAPEDEV